MLISVLNSLNTALVKPINAWQGDHQLAQAHPKQSIGLMADR